MSSGSGYFGLTSPRKGGTSSWYKPRRSNNKDKSPSMIELSPVKKREPESRGLSLPVRSSSTDTAASSRSHIAHSLIEHREDRIESDADSVGNAGRALIEGRPQEFVPDSISVKPVTTTCELVTNTISHPFLHIADKVTTGLVIDFFNGGNAIPGTLIQFGVLGTLAFLTGDGMSTYFKAALVLNFLDFAYQAYSAGKSSSSHLPPTQLPRTVDHILFSSIARVSLAFEAVSSPLSLTGIAAIPLLYSPTKTCIDTVSLCCRFFSLSSRF